MRTIKLTIAVTAMAALVAVVPMAASGAISDFEQKQNNKIKKASNKAKKAINQVADLGDSLASSNTTQNNKNTSQDEAIAGLQSTVTTIVAGVPAIVDGLTQLKAGLVAAGDGLNAISAALQDPVTGLVGLNLARPQFGAFEGAGGTPGNMIDGTGRHGAQGPDSDASVNGGLDQYVVDFNNNIDAKSLVVNVAPQDPLGAGPTPHGEAVSCNAHAAYTAACGAILGGLGPEEFDEDNFVLVELDAPPVLGFTVTALSG